MYLHQLSTAIMLQLSLFLYFYGCCLDPVLPQDPLPVNLFTDFFAVIPFYVTNNACTPSIGTSALHKSWPTQLFVARNARVQRSRIPTLPGGQEGKEAVLDARFVAVLRIALVVADPALGAFCGKPRSVLQTSQGILSPKEMIASTHRHDVCQRVGRLMVDFYVLYIGAVPTVPAVEDSVGVAMQTNLIRFVQVQSGSSCCPHATFGLFANNEVNR